MKIVRFIAKLFWKLHSDILLRNNSFKNIHKDEKCYLIGNGASLKYIDYTLLPKFKAIGTTYLLLDTRTKYLDIAYYIIPDTYIYYKYCYTPRLKKFTKNYKAIFFKEFIKKYKKINFFVHLSNYYALFQNPNNLNFYYDAESKNLKKGIDKNLYDITCPVQPLYGSLDIMLNIAKFMGFKEVILLGCDYLGDPVLQGHLYSNSEPFIENGDNLEYIDRIKEIAKNIDVTVILPENTKCNIFRYKSIKEYTGKVSNYRKNSDFISKENIDLLNLASRNKQLFM